MPRCPTCGTDNAAFHSPEGLCPRCLLKQVIEGRRDAEDLSLSERETLATLTRSPEGPADTTAAEMSPGQSFGPYKIVRLLGRGGMGMVYEANDRDTGRRVAIKLLAEAADSPTDRERFLREGRLAAQVSHPNSVYVFGTAEIEGVQVIAMELLPGGTLNDRLRESGPLPPVEAVDAALELVAGLEAAEAKGVLHRDIKPANCFVDRDGTVKIGDFGLSISTLRGEPRLTSRGTLMGTPAFASPEQIQGKELDVRSDFYSLGATLYNLLTGRPPILAEDLVQQIAKILQEKPISPETLRSDIPKGLARLVLRLLEKSPMRRPASYDEVREALLPFSSRTPTPARLRRRLAAGLLDNFILGILAAPLNFATTIGALSEFVSFAPFVFVGPLAGVFYFAVSEGIWGTSPGKGILGLRVLGPDRTIPGLQLALLRASAWQLPSFVTALAMELIRPQPGDQAGLLLYGSPGLTFVLWIVMFSTARETNGFAGLHDLMSKTRVVVKAAEIPEPSRRSDRESLEVSADAHRVGPYMVVRSLADADSGALLLGYDPQLRRRVWLHLPPEGTPAVPAVRHQIHRRGRPRWLNGKRADGECWDAYEAIEGQAFREHAAKKQAWSRVQLWLVDLANELAASVEEGLAAAVPELDRVWITDDGAKILDFPAPGACGASARDAAALPAVNDRQNSEAIPGDSFASIQQFLYRMAITATHGRPESRDLSEHSGTGVVMPLSARSLVGSLARQEFENKDVLAESLESLVRKPSTVTRLRRFGSIYCYVHVPFVLTIFLFAAFLVLFNSHQRYPDRAAEALLECRTYYANNRWARTMCTIGSLLAGSIASGPDTDLAVSDASQSGLEQREGASLEESQREFRRLVADELAGIEVPSSFLSVASNTLASAEVPLRIFWPAAFIWAILLPGGLLFRLFGIAVVSSTGEEITRPRSFFRALLAWSPLLVVYFVDGYTSGLSLTGVWSRFAPGGIPVAVGVCLLAAGAVYAVWNPGRGLQDRVAGTYLVPR